MRTHLLLFPQSEQTNPGHLHNLETYTRNITLGLTPTTETRDENLVVLIHKVQATIVLQIKTPNISPSPQKKKKKYIKSKRTHGYESRDLLSVLDELHTDTFPDGRVGLFCLNTDFLEHNSFCMGRTSSGRGFVGVTKGTFLV
jgi:hypothetical protein